MARVFVRRRCQLRRYIPWREADRSKFLGRGSYGEPRFLHRHEDITIYPELPRPVLTYNRHVGDRAALLIPDVEYIMTGFEPFLAQAAHPISRGGQSRAK